MSFSKQFICATTDFTTFEHFVPAPYFRKTFTAAAETQGEIYISSLGFYELYVNGERITKGALAPYISNPDDYLYYDRYEVKINPGKNAIGICLGNGFQNNPGGHIWDFDKAAWRSAPAVALSLDFTDTNGTHHFESDNSFLTAESPIRFDDMRFGEHYDANLEQNGWNLPGYDDSGWKSAIPAAVPRGETCVCEAEPIVVREERAPVLITKSGDGWLYDFGLNDAGVCRLKVNGKKGQKIELLHGERLVDGELDISNIWFVREHWERDRLLVHRDIYICRGGENEEYIPRFTYHGFRYVLVTGITEQQATPDLLSYLVMSSDIKECGGFTCSDETVNKLQEMTRRSVLSNFFYFPTDCPHREKNGWTGDAALSAEHMLMNLKVENSLREWLRNIAKSQSDNGAFPGIIPTGGWGYDWGNGPVYDQILVNIPYFTYIYRGESESLKEVAPFLMRYLHYLTTRVNKEGLICFGLGDWCPAGRWADNYKSPLELTDTVTAKDIADKCAFIFGVLGMTEQREFALSLSERLRRAVRERLIDFSTMTVLGSCQTSQAVALYYNIFDPAERPEAAKRLVQFVEQCNGHIDTGIVGGRVLFHVLSEFGYSDLAFNMITRPDFPSYGYWIERGATTLWEDFQTEDCTFINSQNHHMWGDISNWFIRRLSGIRFNPHKTGLDEVDIAPAFVERLTFAEGFYESPGGKIRSHWERVQDGITLTLEIPEGMTGRIILENGYIFDTGKAVLPAQSGSYKIKKL